MRYDDLQLMGKALFYWQQKSAATDEARLYEINQLPDDRIEIILLGKAANETIRGNDAVTRRSFTTTSEAFHSMLFAEENQRLIDFLMGFDAAT